MGNTGGRVGGTHERKAEDSDTNSNNAAQGVHYITRSLALYLLQRLISLPTRLSQE